MWFVCLYVRVNNSCRAASRDPVNTFQTVNNISHKEVNSTVQYTDHSSITPIRNKGKRCIKLLFLYPKHIHTALHACRQTSIFVLSCLQAVCEPEEVLVPALPETSRVERGYITPQQVYNLLNAEEGQPALYDPYYILILDCRSAERWVLLRSRIHNHWRCLYR